MVNIFSSIPVRRPKRNKFNLSHEVKLTCNIGDLIPADWYEVGPGDEFEHRVESLIRFQALMAPLMHRVDVYFHHFFVPNRLLWDEFENFITGGEDGLSKPVPPQISFTSSAGGWSEAQKSELMSFLRVGTLSDYLGLPTIPQDFNPEDWKYPMVVNALPFRAYALIYNEWYRDQNLQEPIEIDKTSGISYTDPDIDNPLLHLRKRNWHKDYFTSALPFLQRGEDVRLPLQGIAPVNIQPGTDYFYATGEYGVQGDLTYNPIPGSPLPDGATNSGEITINKNARPSGKLHYNPGLMEADMTEVSSTTVNELRRSIKLQEWLEKNARGGARYIEQIFAHFGVMGKDARLQRPQYLGGSKSPVTISEVVQQSATGAGDTPQGNLAGKALSVMYDNGYKRFFDEHGIVMTIMSIIPKANYQQGLPRKFQRRDKFDYYFPEFAHLGEQAIFKSELKYDFSKSTASQQDSQSDESAVPFGYTPRYAEYKTELNRVHGQFKDSLNFWHMGRIFDNVPGLNGDFVQVDGMRDDLNRVFATDQVTDAYGREIDKIEVQIYHQIKAKRPMPKYGVPMI